ncbi:sulfite exporter TauE/SafE family protein [Anaerobium acetethylicum]|uniref:Probable membrane transporter protein n=1 Tax=Anaerobium acetethylicum TaxID=1619234 RepID=A0A1D3TQT8_9FIRM|nr:sulfite exporter TauE/SafE family protein [Anaerobium acetethylicum]SCP96010.1 hypothetical protein SAMN05421730_1003110 [Anaerobium acetethylicum]
MYIIFLAISFFASVIGAICGIGGGVIIKPVLDATGVMGVSSISFLSGCTVLSMSLISVFRNRKNVGESAVDFKTATPMAIGAAIGGVAGKEIFQYAYVLLPDENKVGAIQAAVLVLITAGTLIYVLRSATIRTRHVRNAAACAIIGLLLGLISAFLGIGGGPINLVVLAYFFSMETKMAAACSLYIIMFSQLTSFASTLIGGKVPEFEVLILVLMVFGGVAGGMAGGKINKKISSEHVNKLFIGLMIVIILINIYNVIKFLG